MSYVFFNVLDESAQQLPNFMATIAKEPGKINIIFLKMNKVKEKY